MTLRGFERLGAAGAERRLRPLRSSAQRQRASVLAAAFGFATFGLLAAWRGRPASWAATPGLAAVGGGGDAPEEATDPCEELRSEIMQKVWPGISRWEQVALRGRTIFGFGAKASRLVNRTLGSFDAQVEKRGLTESGGACAAERASVEKLLKQQLHSIFLVQRSTIEQTLYQRLKKDLLRKMQRKKRELNVKEKLRLLHSCMHDYDSQVRELLPSFVENTERDRAEKRLSKLQWGVHELPEAKEMQQRWKMERMRKMGTMRQSKGLSVSLSPGMRLMFRPPGFGNFQVYSRRQVGPPHNPNEVAMGLLNDGNVVDVYNKNPQPPLIKFQPTVGVDVSTG
mmetsp:Transcript_87013/g.219026  ORF Transcript_87013/g.219026 Transcript_87013/m.219026 type:complete len:340 (+) Transcript_87013:79-1098(+)